MWRLHHRINKIQKPAHHVAMLPKNVCEIFGMLENFTLLYE